MGYKFSHEAKMDLARIYWHGVKTFGEHQAENYIEKIIQRCNEIAETPYKYQSVEHIREAYHRSVCGVDSIYFRIHGEMIEIMRILGR
jgi:toxin ParE1/3/4